MPHDHNPEPHDHPTEPHRHDHGHARQVAALLDLEIGYRGQAILPPLNVCLHAGEMWALVGRNGAGKSTLIRSLLGLQPTLRGEVRLDTGVRVAYVAQRTDHHARIPARVQDFVEGGLDVGWSFLRPWLTAPQKTVVDQALRDVDLWALRERSLATLSYGQRQRAHIARALATNPQLLVLDEPTSAMDPINERAVFELLAGLARRRQIAVLLSSHQMSFLPDHADHALLVDRDLGIAVGGDLRKVFWSHDFRRVYGDVHFGVPTEDGCAG